MTEYNPENVIISQTVAILIDGNNIERSIHEQTGDPNTMLNFDKLIPKLLDNRGLNRLIYFREGKQISQKLRERLHEYFHGSVRPCHKSADIPLSITAMQLASKVDTIVIMSGDSDYIELIRHLKSEGVRVEIASVDATTAKIIKEECDHHYRINEDDWFSYSSKQSGRSTGKTNRHRSNRKSQANSKQQDNKNEAQPESNQSDIITNYSEPSKKYKPAYPQSQNIKS